MPSVGGTFRRWVLNKARPEGEDVRGRQVGRTRGGDGGDGGAKVVYW